MRTREIPLFLGTSTSVDKKNLQPFQASRELNVTHEDGSLRARRGYKNLRAAQSGHTANYALIYLQGINSSNAEVEEYITVEAVSGSTDAFSRHVTTLAPTAITGATGLHSSSWTGFAFGDLSYIINPNHTTDVYRHVIGDTTSWVAIQTPADPTTALTVDQVYTAAGANAYAQLSWAGLDPTSAGEMAVTGAAQNTGSVLNSDSTFTVRHNTSQGAASFAVDMNDITATAQDWSYNDAFAFTLTEDPSNAFHIDPGSIQVELTNDSPAVTHTLIVSAVRMTATLIYVYCYAQPKTRTDWDSIDTFKVSYSVIQRSTTAANNDLTMGKPFVGACFPFAVSPGGSSDVGFVRFGYSYYFSTPALESGVAGEVSVWGRDTNGYDPLAGPGGPPVLGTRGLGSFLKFTITASGDANVDNARLYWFDSISTLSRPTSPNVWRRIVTQNDATTTYTLKASLEEMLALAERTGTGGFLTSPIVNAFPFKEWVVWCYGLAEANVRHSRVREAEILASDQDQDDDEKRGVNFTLADNAADTPLGGCQVADSAVIFGSNGVYEQVYEGGGPSGMSPTKKLPSSFGAAGKFAFARWRDDDGNPGAAFVDRHGSGVYFAYPSGVGDRDAEGRVIELSLGIRGEVRRFLFDEQTGLSLTDFSTCEVFVDDLQDALWVKMGKRAMVLRRANTATGEREWEFYEYNTGGSTVTISRVAASSKRLMRMMRSDGKIDELEWNSADGVFIQGLNRDGGNPMPQGFWRSKAHSGQNRRIIRLFLERSIPSETARVKVFSNRLEQAYRLEANRKFAACAPLQQGFDHEFEIIVPEMDGKYSRLFWDEVDLGRRTNL